MLKRAVPDGQQPSKERRLKTLADLAQLFEKCMDSARDEHGLLYDELNAHTMQPWTDSELRALGAASWPESAALPSMAWGGESKPTSCWSYGLSGGYTYENSVTTTGRYICAKILKHLATGGDEGALSDAEGAVRALLALSEEGDKVEKGLLPKPFGGLKKASQSTGMSNDQYEHALLGLCRFRRACPDSPLVPEIESAIVRWTQYFLREDWSYLFHGRYWACLEPCDRGDYPVSALVHPLGLYMPLCLMSHEFTGDQQYLDQFHHRLLPVLQRWIQNPAERFTGHTNSCELQAMGMYFCQTQGFIAKEAQQALEHCWNMSKKRLSPDSLDLDLYGMTQGHRVRPRYLDVELPDTGGKRGLWISNMKTPQSLKTAHTGTLLQRLRHEADRGTTIRRILERFQTVTDITNLIDQDGKQVPPDHKYMTESICVEMVAAWLQVYYMSEVLVDEDGL